MMSAMVANMVLSGIFTDSDSPYALGGFAVSLHADAAQADGATEVLRPSYARAVIGCGPTYWAVGGRSAINVRDVVFPRVADGDQWDGIRSVGIWGYPSEITDPLLLWTVSLDSAPQNLAPGDRLTIPSGGLVVGIA